MKKLFILLIISPSIYSLPCPNGGGPLYRGDSIESVIKSCGPPQNQTTHINKVSTAKRLIYYLPTPYNAGTSQLSILFKNGTVSGMSVSERNPIVLCRQNFVQLDAYVATVQTSCGDYNYNTTYTTLCGAPIRLGDTEENVLAVCGKPNQTMELENKISYVTELSYTSGSTQTLVFEDGKLTDWR